MNDLSKVFNYEQAKKDLKNAGYNIVKMPTFKRFRIIPTEETINKFGYGEDVVVYKCTSIDGLLAWADGFLHRQKLLSDQKK